LHPSEHPAAVNEDVWDAAQAKFDRNRAANASRSPRAWPFAGIAKCGSCGHSLRLHNTGRSGRYVYLRCHDRACKQNGKSPISAIFEANVIVALVAIAYAVTTLLAEDPEFAVPIGPADETLAAARERVKTMNTELERVRNILITTGGAADDPRLLHLLDQRDAAREEAMILGRTMTDYRAELQALAESIFSLRYHVPPYDQAWLVKDWAMGPGFTPLFPDEMAEAVLLGWQHAPFDDRVTVVRNALSAVIYHGEEVELRFRSAVPERITTSAALIAERSPLVNALDEDGWGRSAYYDALAADESLAKPVWEGTGLDAPEPELGLTRPGSTPGAGPPLAAVATRD
jgi:hypothetical protein